MVTEIWVTLEGTTHSVACVGEYVFVTASAFGVTMLGAMIGGTMV
jgi:hypothetical protein